ncbi:hypothetical protein MCA1570 [Methylococcus capsulatus str. Bath]|uniref:Uncharacterized protein n=1 Tax=Methylococcus capsulatus (strain ATCC 33009 / NCIMB 11132 / Bath) TaxID=243233 RepID=Q608C5_METCA|nr:hypothetical protein MCA1570 [Methylococcus capsulatus str. Bath]
MLASSELKTFRGLRPSRARAVQIPLRAEEGGLNVN